MPDTPVAPVFLADTRALDFLNTLSGPPHAEVEWLADGSKWLAWLRASGWVDASVLDGLRASATPGELDAVALQAREMREWFRGFVARHRGKPLTRHALTELEPLNRLLSRDVQFRQIGLQPKEASNDANTALTLMIHRRWHTPETLLYPVADAIAQFVTSADFTDVKHCEGPGCTLHFLDTTRDHRRRWCSMAVCGNRAKQAAHRLRRTAGT